MKQIKLDTGVESYRIGGGVLRFNPADPNLYSRFLAGVERIRGLEADLHARAETTEPLVLLGEADAQIKEVLQEIFGGDNDMAAIFGNANLLAVGSNGERILQNFLTALEPILTEGARRCAAQRAQKL